METPLTAPERKISPVKILDFGLKYGVYSIFVLIIIIFSLSNERFLTVPNFMMLLQ